MKLMILNQDGVGLFETLPENISAEVDRVIIGGVCTDFYKLTVSNGVYSFLVGIFNNKKLATKNLMSLHKTLKKARQGKYHYDGWQPNDCDLTALDLLEELEGM